MSTVPRRREVEIVYTNTPVDCGRELLSLIWQQMEQEGFKYNPEIKAASQKAISTQAAIERSVGHEAT